MCGLCITSWSGGTFECFEVRFLYLSSTFAECWKMWITNKLENRQFVRCLWEIIVLVYRPHMQAKGSVCWSWVVGRGSQVVGRGFQVVGRGSQVVGRGSQVVGRGFQVVGCGFQVVGCGFQVVGRGSWVIDWKGSALARRQFFGIPSISKQTLSSLQQQIIHVF